jgi:hypothetical protein
MAVPLAWSWPQAAAWSKLREIADTVHDDKLSPSFFQHYFFVFQCPD